MEQKVTKGIDKSPGSRVQRNGRGFVDHRRFESIPDQEIITSVLDGDINLFEVLLRRYNQQVYRVARSYLSDEEDAKEVVQNVFVNAFEHLEQFRGESRFPTWLIRITINEALKYHNRQKKYRDVERSELNGYDYSPVERDTPESRAVRSDLKQLLEKAVDTLPQKYRTVYIMREIEQMSTKETAHCLNITRINVKVRLHRSKNLLRKELIKYVMDKNIFDFKGDRCDHMVHLVMNHIYEWIRDHPQLVSRN